MIDQLEDVTHRTKGALTYEGTVRFKAEGETFGTESWLFHASDEADARRTLTSLSEESIYADPRIDHVRDLEIEEHDYDAEIVDPPAA